MHLTPAKAPHMLQPRTIRSILSPRATIVVLALRHHQPLNLNTEWISHHRASCFLCNGFSFGCLGLEYGVLRLILESWVWCFDLGF